MNNSPTSSSSLISAVEFDNDTIHFRYDDVNSTNEIAKNIAARKNINKFWVSAVSQNTGKGSRGRTWVSPPGNLYASHVIDVSAPAHIAATLTFVASLALKDALSNFVDASTITLKWPNDVLLNGAKLSGILLEFEQKKQYQGIAVVGFGVNVINYPAETNYPATSLLEYGIEIKPGTLLESLNHTFADKISRWDNGNGFLYIREDWMANAAGIGEMVTVNMPRGTHYGIFEEIDNHGALVLNIDGVREKLSVGDVFLH